MLLALTHVFPPSFHYADLDSRSDLQVVVDREPGQYLGHPSTVLLEDGKTILIVYPKGHGSGTILMKRSLDGGKTWSDRLPTPNSWTTSKETPTLHRVVDPKSKHKRLVLWSGLQPARLASSENDGESWTELAPVGAWGGIVVMGFVERLKNGDYLAMFHDDGRFFLSTPQATGIFTLYATRSKDGGRTWSFPEAVFASSDVHLCEPGVVRSPDGKTLAVLLRENARKRNSHIIFSHDEGKSWSLPRALPAELTGDRHTARYLKDGKLFISFRNMPIGSTQRQDWKGDWVAWIGTWDDLVHAKQGQALLRLKDNHDSWDCAYPGVEVLPDGTVVAVTYGHWEKGQSPYILAVRIPFITLLF